MRAGAGRAALLGLTLVLLAAPACSAPRRTCGTPRPGGGPPILETREQELCETVRLAAIRYLESWPALTAARAADLALAARSWTRADSVASLIARLERDVDAPFAVLVLERVRWAKTKSELPAAETDDPDRALAGGAGHGAYLAAAIAPQIVPVPGR